jgi:hypothetical protein
MALSFTVFLLMAGRFMVIASIVCEHSHSSVPQFPSRDGCRLPEADFRAITTIEY